MVILSSARVRTLALADLGHWYHHHHHCRTKVVPNILHHSMWRQCSPSCLGKCFYFVSLQLILCLPLRAQFLGCHCVTLFVPFFRSLAQYGPLLILYRHRNVLSHWLFPYLLLASYPWFWGWRPGASEPTMQNNKEGQTAVTSGFEVRTDSPAIRFLSVRVE